MKRLKFRKGSRRENIYDVDIDFEYTADLEKRVTKAVFHQPKTKFKAKVPWEVLEKYLTGREIRAYADSSGLKIQFNDGNLHITNPPFLHLVVTEKQQQAILSAAYQLKENISSSVERILDSFASPSYGEKVPSTDSEIHSLKNRQGI